MAYASVSYPTNGVDNLFSVPFGYISKTHILVYLSGVSVGFTWITNSTIAINVVPSAGLVVTISRTTPIGSRLVDFIDGTILTENTLETDSNQAFYLLQETRDALTNVVAAMLPQTTLDQITSNAVSSAVLEVTGMPEWGLTGIHITQSATAPVAPAEGDVWYDSANYNKSYQWRTDTWAPLVTALDGSLVVNGTIVGAKIAAGEIGASHINVTTLSAISADIGTITTGSLNLTSLGTHRIELSSDGIYPIWYGTGAKNDTNGKFYFKQDGTAVFKGQLSAASGTFAGSLSAATGTFAGNLSAAGGTFAGTLTAGAVNAVNSINIAGNAVTVPDSAYTAAVAISAAEHGTWKTIQTISINTVVAGSVETPPVYIHASVTAGFGSAEKVPLSFAITNAPAEGSYSFVLQVLATRGGSLQNYVGSAQFRLYRNSTAAIIYTSQIFNWTSGASSMPFVGVQNVSLFGVATKR